MYKTLSKITGFESYDSPVRVNDERGRIFYFMPNKSEKRIIFNMPPGKYFFESDCSELKRPLRYECPALDKKEKNIAVVNDLEIIITDNPNKASFENKTGRMVLDNSFIEKTKPQIRFVMGHELGHNYYFSEEKCDYYSAYTMLSEGYNPTQCYYANSFCLSDRQEERKEILFTRLQKVVCHE